ncbi:MAG: winged helix-turn-helix transcriptional regulator [Planctomycetes bacterium]|nr:winged helix-turn-helix transcriptional regulator [Planctomycetota bacterium]MCW8136628.1 winged helix-turn-helix transcriptional regulator [Planctomycetota bacterium]
MPRKKSKPMSPGALSLVAARFKVLGEPARLSLLNALMQKDLNVNELVQATGLSQANVSKHLGMLADTGFVSRRRHGLFTVYSIEDQGVYQLCDLMCDSIARRLGNDLREIA